MQRELNSQLPLYPPNLLWSQSPSTIKKNLHSASQCLLMSFTEVRSICLAQGYSLPSITNQVTAKDQDWRRGEVCGWEKKDQRTCKMGGHILSDGKSKGGAWRRWAQMKGGEWKGERIRKKIWEGEGYILERKGTCTQIRGEAHPLGRELQTSVF